MRPVYLFSVITIASAILGAGCSAPSNPTPVTLNCHPLPTNDQMASSTMQKLSFPGILSADEINKKVLLKTSEGDITIQISADMGPCAASNFVYLVKQGFYNGLNFHRIIPGFMIQGGDPFGDGSGGPGYQFDNDPVTLTKTKTFQTPNGSSTLPVYEDGWIAMANAGKNTNGSQFFIMVDDYPLPPDYSVFGKVVDGLDIAKKISQVATDTGDHPVKEVKILEAKIL